MGLLEDDTKTTGKVSCSTRSSGLADDQSTHIVETEPFSNTFGPKAQRKRPRINVGSFAELGESSQAASEAKEGRTSSRLTSRCYTDCDRRRG
jgi:nuclear GTP-binding protein